MKYREQIAGASGFIEINLSANTRQYALQNLKVFTRYGIMVAAVNEKGPGPFTPVYDVTTGEKRKFSCYPLTVTTTTAATILHALRALFQFCTFCSRSRPINDMK